MSDSQAYEELTISRDGVTVIKTFEADAFPVPAIAFRIQSDRSRPVTVRFVDKVPQDVAVEDLGFHPEYGSEYWTIEDDEITFEREIEANTEYTTVYGIRATGADDIEKFLTEPKVEKVDPPLDGDEDVVGSSSSQVVRDAISGEADSVPGLGDDEADDDEIELSDPNEGELDDAIPDDDAVSVDVGDGEPAKESTSEEIAESIEDVDVDESEAQSSDNDAIADSIEEIEDVVESEPDDASPANTNGTTAGVTEVGSSPEAVASALAAAIRDGTVSDDDLEVIRDELGGGGGGGGSGSVDARIQHLQSKVSDVEAYADAMEEFLDEQGSADLIDDFRDDLNALQEDLSDVQDQSASNEDDIDDLTSSLDDIEAEIEALQDKVDASFEDIEAKVDDKVDEVEARVDDKVDEVETRVDDKVDDMETRIDDKVDDMETRIDDKVDDVESDIDEKVESVQSDIDDAMDDVDQKIDRIEALESEMDGAVEEMQAQIDDKIDDLEREIESRIADLEDKIDDRLDDLEDDFGNIDEKVDTIEELESEMSDLQSMRDDIEDLQEWRSQLSNVLG